MVVLRAMFLAKSVKVFIFAVNLVIFYGADGAIDDACTLEKNGLPGICKLLLDCQTVRDEVVKSNRLPQTCGFKETHPIVCCPKNGENSRQPGVISKIKCKKYSELTNGGAKNECGHKIRKRIIGGVAASRKEFPHMAILGHQSDETSDIHWSCGGTLISEVYVVTVADCVKNQIIGEVKYVKIGITNLNDDDHKQEFKVVERIIHPDYNPRYAYNDIGLVKLDKPVKINEYVRPACLYTNNEVLPNEAVATGWGLTDFAGDKTNVLLKVTLDITDYDKCNASYKDSGRKLKNGIDKESQLCYGSVGKDTCQGDSGGPLQIYHDGDDILCMHDLVGVISFGKGCGIVAGVYTKVPHFLKWIEDIVWPISLS